MAPQRAFQHGLGSQRACAGLAGGERPAQRRDAGVREEGKGAARIQRAEQLPEDLLHDGGPEVREGQAAHDRVVRAQFVVLDQSGPQAYARVAPVGVPQQIGEPRVGLDQVEGVEGAQRRLDVAGHGARAGADFEHGRGRPGPGIT
ncbi:hypothetical protein MTF69_05025 [Streptomyces sp. AP-93]|nr:hypothetical protein [Streptomyces sp. AP-93]